ncbi:hypothetical protein BH23BAC1_BH23BAC1_35300 [soil metagenome]
MDKSAELRWIFPGNLPSDIFKIFSQSSFLSHEDFREDIYLKFPASITVGVKFRESNLEIKPLIQSLGNFKITDEVAGLIEIWEKWSCNLQEDNFFYKAAISEGLWIKVGKERWIRKFINNKGITEVSGDSSSDFGCSVEISKIKYEEKIYWSLGFETFGNFENPEMILKEITIYFFEKILTKVTFDLSNGEEGSFKLNYSCSYPLWLKNQ